MPDIDPVAIIGVASTIVGILVTYFATNARALRYLKVATKLTDIGNSYFQGDADKTWSDLEYQAFGKDVIELIKEVQNDVNIPAEITSLEGKTI
ncbi:MAG: hypothetical protein WC877_01405 [Dehalococcoidales bacterium]|jgi:hypothetical protein